MKVWLATQHFHTNKELMDGVNNWLCNLVAPFFDEGLQKLVSGYDKCLKYGWQLCGEVMQLCNCSTYSNKLLFSSLYFFNQSIGGWFLNLPTYFNSAELRSFSDMTVSKLHVYMCHSPENITLHHIPHLPLSVTLLEDIIKTGTQGA
jgi:hypothetical protein